MEGLIFGILRCASAPWDQFLKKDISAVYNVRQHVLLTKSKCYGHD